MTSNARIYNRTTTLNRKLSSILKCKARFPASGGKTIIYRSCLYIKPRPQLSAAPPLTCSSAAASKGPHQPRRPGCARPADSATSSQPFFKQRSQTARATTPAIESEVVVNLSSRGLYYQRGGEQGLASGTADALQRRSRWLRDAGVVVRRSLLSSFERVCDT
jgi:hypothetical protein